MKPENTFLQVQRVGNGWVISGMSSRMYRDGGYLPDESLVAETPEKLAAILQAWASSQAGAA